MKKNNGTGVSSKTPMDAALNYLTARSRTAAEMGDYLDSKNFGEAEVDRTIERLKELGYLDDLRFAREFVASRMRAKPVSRRKLQEQLYLHKLPQEVIEEALNAVTEETESENASLIAKKYFEQFAGLPDKERAERVGRRLIARGFDYDTARRCITYNENEQRE
jgi:regulatory protein